MGGLGGKRLRWLLPIGGVELAQVARHALLDLSQTPPHLCPREVLVTGVHRFELAAVNGDTRGRQQTYRSAKRNELRANLANRRPVIPAEIGNRLVIGDQPTREPHHFNVASSFALKPAARLYAIEVAVDV